MVDISIPRYKKKTWHIEGLISFGVYIERKKKHVDIKTYKFILVSDVNIRLWRYFGIIKIKSVLMETKVV